jgi:enamine deaminase RidA (YjgF/YER057c/UK114 family)
VTGRASLVVIGEQNGIDPYGNLVGDDPLAQAHQALRNVELAVQAAGGSLADIVKWTIKVTDPATLVPASQPCSSSHPHGARLAKGRGARAFSELRARR